MARSTVLLVNPNLMRPPIGPIGLEYVADALERRGFDPVACDLSFEDDWEKALAAAIADARPAAVGVSVRNIDDAYFASRDFVLETTRAMVQRIGELTDAPVVLGGVGFSFAPAEVLGYTGADFGVAGEGEEAFPALLEALGNNEEPSGVPGAVFRGGNGTIVSVAPAFCDLHTLPPPARRHFDNARYFREGGQGGVETKRGCNCACVYCVEPFAKGRKVRLRRPENVVAEFKDLLEQGVDAVHLCDSEFNIPAAHAHAICRALTERGIAKRLRWYTYAAAVPFDGDLALAMADAGCVGVNFGADHANPEMLRRLGRDYGPEDIRRTAQACRDAGLVCMFDLLLGSPGETRDTLAEAIAFVRDAGPDCVGLSCGVRVYPNTPMAAMVRRQGPMETNPNLHGAREDNQDFLKPVFFVDAAVGGSIHAVVSEFVEGDERFFHTDPSQVDRNYNYNDNTVLAAAIRNGARGAYWDILRKLAHA